ncbi:hypothetical protein [Luteibacter yeojuensis]|uniref:Uncharacterized protein n=1 Tax=Luteibacter yeojuensis TaxID=345309 RepID=A0A0F3KWN9_9GAMM|nr:hypothetical protein [Luteibacter yeojuensis]KJV35680.1 hypothetical protein VI08_06635 [Luteibacter yeojuensis]
MFITNKATPEELLSEFLRGHDAPDIESEFRDLAHNNDLCPQFTERVDMVLQSYARHHTYVDDIQAMNDQGVDIFFRYRADGMESKNVGIQIKSYKEIEDSLKKDREGEPLESKLASQYLDAKSKHGVKIYYIFLCGDGALVSHANLERRIRAKYSSMDDVVVVGPKKAWAFYSLHDYEIAAHCASILCDGDYVLQRARESLNDFKASQQRMLIAWVLLQLEGERYVDVGELQDYGVGYGADDEEDDDLSEDMANLIDRLERYADLEYLDGETYKIDPSAFPELCALYFDLRVRHGISGGGAIRYLHSLLV